MDQLTLLSYVVGVLARLDLSYFITGSIASSKFGEGRFTFDIDVVVKLPVECIAAFCRAFPPEEYYLSPEAVRSAVDRGGQFNIIHPTTGHKVDMMIGGANEFDRHRFGRTVTADIGEGLQARFASPEDVIIKKMLYYREGGHEKHTRDIASILKIRGDQLDLGYIERWVRDFGLEEIWKPLLYRWKEM